MMKTLNELITERTELRYEIQRLEKENKESETKYSVRNRRLRWLADQYKKEQDEWMDIALVKVSRNLDEMQENRDKWHRIARELDTEHVLTWRTLDSIRKTLNSIRIRYRKLMGIYRKSQIKVTELQTIIEILDEIILNQQGEIQEIASPKYSTDTIDVKNP